MITLTFPDGAERQYPAGISGREIVEGIAKSLAKRTVAMALDGTVADLADPITHDAKIEFLTRDDPRALELIRHDCRACARRGGAGSVPRHPGDDRTGDRERLLLRFRAGRALHPRRLRGDRGEDARDHRARQTLHQGSLEPREGQAGLCRQGRDLQARADRRDPGRRGPEDLFARRLVRPLPGSAHDLDRQDRHRLQAHEGGGRLLARRFQQPDADPHLWDGLGQPGRARRLSARSSRKPRSAITAASAGRWTCSISRRRGRASCSGTRRAGRCSRS